MLRKHLDSYYPFALNLIAVSGGFDPLTNAHIRYIQTSASLIEDKRVNKLVVIANRDSWLIRKKGFAFMPEAERFEILSAINGVDFVVPWDDGNKDVSACLRILRPNIFANGGDRSSIENVPEYPVCQEIDCTMYFGVGGNEKIQSSSSLVEKAVMKINEQKK